MGYNKKSIKSRIGCNDMIMHLLSSMGGSEKERLVLLIKTCKTLKHYFIQVRKDFSFKTIVVYSKVLMIVKDVVNI